MTGTEVRQGVVVGRVDRTAYPVVGIRTIGPVGGIEMEQDSMDWRVQQEVGEEQKKDGAGGSDNWHKDSSKKQGFLG